MHNNFIVIDWITYAMLTEIKLEECVTLKYESDVSRCVLVQVLSIVLIDPERPFCYQQVFFRFPPKSFALFVALG